MVRFIIVSDVFGSKAAVCSSKSKIFGVFKVAYFIIVSIIGKETTENNVVKKSNTDAYPLSFSKLSANIGAIAAVGIAANKTMTLITVTGPDIKCKIKNTKIGIIKSFINTP